MSHSQCHNYTHIQVDISYLMCAIISQWLMFLLLAPRPTSMGPPPVELMVVTRQSSVVTLHSLFVCSIRQRVPHQSATLLLSVASMIYCVGYHWQHRIQKGVLRNYTSAHGSGRRYSVLLQKFIFLFFLSPKDLRDGSTNSEPFQLRWSDIGVILKIGSKIWGVGDPPLKFGGPNPRML